MSQVFKPVSYTNLANLAVATSSAASGTWSPLGSKTCLRLSSTTDLYFTIVTADVSPTATAANPILTAGQETYITVNSNAAKISTIGPDNGSDDPIIQFATDGGNESHHNFKIGDKIQISGVTGGSHFGTWNSNIYTVTKTDVNEAALGATRIAVATTASLDQSIGGVARLGFKIAAVRVSVDGRLSVTEVATTG
jgi:hypothetical protein